MRLICPRCGAQYEIDAAAIPAAGRDVECSACDHVWRAWPMPEPAAPFDPTARPRLSRPLSESVIEILREEAARELEVRAAERRLQRLAEAGAAEAPLSDAAAASAGAPSPDDTLLPGDAPAEHSRDTGDARRPIAAAPTATPPDRQSASHAASPPATRSPPAPAAVIPAATPPAVPAPIARPQPAVAWAAAPLAPALAGSRRRYDAGFHLAVMLALLALALYALAPRLGDQPPFGATLLEWRDTVDQGRDWLSSQGDAVIAGLRAVIDRQGAAGD